MRRHATRVRPDRISLIGQPKAAPCCRSSPVIGERSHLSAALPSRAPALRLASRSRKRLLSRPGGGRGRPRRVMRGGRPARALGRKRGSQAPSASSLGLLPRASRVEGRPFRPWIAAPEQAEQRSLLLLSGFAQGLPVSLPS